MYNKVHTIALTEYITAEFHYTRSTKDNDNTFTKATKVAEAPEVDQLRFFFSHNGATKQLEGPFTPKLITTFINAEARYLESL